VGDCCRALIPNPYNNANRSLLMKIAAGKNFLESSKCNANTLPTWYPKHTLKAHEIMRQTKSKFAVARSM
jgi:hypothetical protein